MIWDFFYLFGFTLYKKQLKSLRKQFYKNKKSHSSQVFIGHFPTIQYDYKILIIMTLFWMLLNILNKTNIAIMLLYCKIKIILFYCKIIILILRLIFLQFQIVYH